VYSGIDGLDFSVIPVLLVNKSFDGLRDCLPNPKVSLRLLKYPLGSENKFPTEDAPRANKLCWFCPNGILPLIIKAATISGLSVHSLGNIF